MKCNNMIAVSGLDWGVDFDNSRVLNLINHYSNILYRVNDNPLTWGTKTFAETSQRVKWQKLLDNKHAVLVGEFFPSAPPPDVEGYRMTVTEKARFIQETLAIIDEYGLSYTESAYSPSNWTWSIIANEIRYPDGSVKYSFTTPGKEIESNLEVQPPNQFDK